MNTHKFLVYSPRYNTNLAEFGIPISFALDRGQRVLDALEQELGERAHCSSPRPISAANLRLVHTPEYLDSLKDARVWAGIFGVDQPTLSANKPIRPLNELIDDVRSKCGGTLLAVKLALKNGLAANLGGGYHHAFPDRGEGFCALNDIAVAARWVLQNGLCRKVMIVDVDLHQGNGTAAAFSGDPNVFYLSVHSQEAWPHEKQKSTLDVPIRRNESHLYQRKLEEAVNQALSKFKPDICIFVAGSDPYERDTVAAGRYFRLTLEQIRKRDEFVIDAFADRGIPLAMVFAGGYGPHVWEVHYSAVRHLLKRCGFSFLPGQAKTA